MQEYSKEIWSAVVGLIFLGYLGLIHWLTGGLVHAWIFWILFGLLTAACVAGIIFNRPGRIAIAGTLALLLFGATWITWSTITAQTTAAEAEVKAKTSEELANYHSCEQVVESIIVVTNDDGDDEVQAALEHEIDIVVVPIAETYQRFDRVSAGQELPPPIVVYRIDGDVGRIIIVNYIESSSDSVRAQDSRQWLREELAKEFHKEANSYKVGGGYHEIDLSELNRVISKPLNQDAE